jgi:hypothetical protein
MGLRDAAPSIPGVAVIVRTRGSGSASSATTTAFVNISIL